MFFPIQDLACTLHVSRTEMSFPLHDSPLSLVVAERGADWPRWAERFEAGTPNVVVVAQKDNEDLSGLSHRVRERLAELSAEDQEVTRAVIVGGGARDSAAMAARHSTIKAIVAPMVALGRGTLILDASGPDRFCMAALASTVASMVRGTGVKVVATSDTIADVA